MLCLSHKSLRMYRTRFGLDGLVEVHHVIPKSCASHAVVRLHEFDIDSPGNLALLPSVAGVKVLTLRPNRVVHMGGHLKYNTYVRSSLDMLDESPLAFAKLLAQLHHQIRRNASVPWN